MTNPNHTAIPATPDMIGGFTKREYFAITMLKKLDFADDLSIRSKVSIAVAYADELIDQLNEN